MKGLLQLEALTVGALDLGGVGLVSANLNGLQTAVILVLAVMGAVVDSALDALIGGIVHNKLLLHERFWLIAGISVCREAKTMYRICRERIFRRRVFRFCGISAVDEHNVHRKSGHSCFFRSGYSGFENICSSDRYLLSRSSLHGNCIMKLF